MKNKTQSLRQVVFYSLFIVSFLSSLNIQAQDKDKVIITKLKNNTYTEELISKPSLNMGYKILREKKANISDSLMKLTIIRGTKTEQLFGFKPATFLKEIHFVADQQKSFFTNEKPSSVFVTTISNPRPFYYEENDDWKRYLLLEKEENMEHEIYHLLDYQLKFSDDSAVLSFMKKLDDLNIKGKLFKLLYLNLSQEVCFDTEIVTKFLDKHKDQSLIGGIQTGVSMDPMELFAQGITTLDSFYWNDVMDNVKKDSSLFTAYKEMLFVFKGSIERCLSRITNNPQDIKNVPIMILLNKRISQLNKM
jgi:hypothetical protein